MGWQHGEGGEGRRQQGPEVAGVQQWGPQWGLRQGQWWQSICHMWSGSSPLAPLLLAGSCWPVDSYRQSSAKAHCLVNGTPWCHTQCPDMSWSKHVEHMSSMCKHVPYGLTIWTDKGSLTITPARISCCRPHAKFWWTESTQQPV